MKWRSLPQMPARRLRTRTQLEAGRVCRGASSTRNGATEEKQTPGQIRQSNRVNMTRLGSRSRVEVHISLSYLFAGDHKSSRITPLMAHHLLACIIWSVSSRLMLVNAGRKKSRPATRTRREKQARYREGRQ